MPCTRTRLPVPEAAKQPHSIMLPPPCLTVGTVFFGLKASCFLRQTYTTSICPKSSSLISSDRSTDFQNSSLPFKCSRANLSLAVMCRSLSKGVLLGRWPWSPPRWRALTTAFLETSTPEEARSATIILADVRGFLLTSLTIFLSRVLEILRLRPCPGLFLTEFVSLYLVQRF